MKAKKERGGLINEFKKLIVPGLKSIEDIKEVETRGAEILSELINDDILKKCLRMKK